METIPFKQVEIVSNEYVYGLLIVVTIIAIIIVALLKVLKKKGVFRFQEKVESGIKILHKRQLSRSTQVFCLEVDGQRLLLAESVRNVSLTPLLESPLNLRQQSETNETPVEVGCGSDDLFESEGNKH